MSNIIKIKHGSNPPAAGVLEEYELGFASSNKGLYLGQGEAEPIYLNDNDTSEIEENISKIEEKITELEKDVGGGVIVSAETPGEEYRNCLWIDTGNNGVAKYYNFDETNPEWVIVPSVWG